MAAVLPLLFSLIALITAPSPAEAAFPSSYQSCAPYLLKSVFEADTASLRTTQVEILLYELIMAENAELTIEGVQAVIEDMKLAQDILQTARDGLEPKLEAAKRSHAETTHLLLRWFPFFSRHALREWKKVWEIKREASTYDYGVNGLKFAIFSAESRIADIIEAELRIKFGVSTHYWLNGASVYNPETKSFEHRSVFKNGIAGVYNPNIKRVEWREELTSGVAGVFNPLTNRVEWRSGTLREGVAGVFNPITGVVEWNTAYNSGIAGVFNPVTGVVEWRDARQAGVLGFWDEEAQVARFFVEEKSGINANPPPGTLISGGGFWGFDSNW